MNNNLIQSEKKYRDIVDNANEAIFVVQDGLLKFFNPKTLEMAGYSKKELSSKPFDEMIHPDDRKMVIRRHSQRIKGQEPPSVYPFRIMDKEGNVKCVEINTAAIDWEGRPATLNFLNDITERKETEKELKDSQERLSIIFKYAPDGYYLNDLKGNLVDGNRAAEELTGYKKEELIGKSFLKLKLLSLKDIPKAASHLARNALGKPTGPDEFTLIRKDGTRAVVEIRTYPVKIKGRTVILGNVRDITARIKAEIQIKKSLEEKEILLKEIHHRVKNNMQVISSLLNIQAGYIKDEEILGIFNALHDRIRSMSLLYEMLYKSKDLARVDLSEYIRNLTTRLISMYRDKVGPIDLKLNVKDVYLDLKRAVPCGLIITELISNSLKHAFSETERGEIAVEMYPDEGEKYILIVRDSGKGFPEGLDFRETESLGMKLVVNFVNQLKGTIELNRKEGTKYKIVF